MRKRCGKRAAWRGSGLGVAVAALVASSAAPAIAGLSSAQRDAVQRIVGAEAANHPNGSMTVAIVIRGRLSWVRSYGFADLGRRVRATPQTVYRIGSITKQFTGYGLLSLAAEGRVRLHDRVVRYVPEIAGPLGSAAERVHLLALATHRAGLAREPDDWQSYSTGRIENWQSLAREALGHSRAPFAPLERGRYSNIGYAALGLAIERAAGLPYTDYIETRLLRPLGMRSTAFRPDATMLARLAVGYRNSRGTETEQSAAELANGRGYRIPNGGLFSTASDLARFMAFEMGAVRGTPIDRATLAANRQRHYPAVGGGRFGVGFIVEEHGSRRLIGHNGLATGYASAAYFDPEAQIGIICLGSAENMCQSRFVDVYAALSPAWVPVARQAEAERAARAARVLAQRPFAQGAERLSAFVASLAVGTPDYRSLSLVLADAVRDNLTALHAQFSGLGALQSVTFAGVDANGADLYETRFANGALRWSLVIDQDGTIRSAVMRPAN